MRKELPSILSVNDAVSLIINLPCQPGATDVLEMLSYFREEAESNLDHAENSDDRKKYTAQVTLYLTREAMARSLMEAIGSELSAISKGRESILEVEDDSFGSEKLITASVCAWADDMGFHIEGWKPPGHWRKKKDRSYTSEYLDIVDDVIATFCEENGEWFYPGAVPTNENIIDYINGKYGQLSEKIVTSIPTIVRQGVTLSTKKRSTPTG